FPYRAVPAILPVRAVDASGDRGDFLARDRAPPLGGRRPRPAARGEGRPSRVRDRNWSIKRAVPRRTQDRPSVALAVMAHPDDAEISMGGTLAAFARRGWSVRIVVC